VPNTHGHHRVSEKSENRRRISKKLVEVDN